MEEKNNDVIKEENILNEEIKSNKGMSIASMVLGIVGLVIFGLPCGILAIIFAILAKKRGKNGMATAGLILGIIDVAFVVLFYIFSMTLVASIF